MALDMSQIERMRDLRALGYSPSVDWQHLLGRFSQRVSPANLNSTGLM